MIHTILKYLLTILVAALPCWAQTASSTGSGTTLRLSQRQAIDIALSPEGSLHLQIAGESVALAKTRSAQSRAALLPNIDAYVSMQSKTVNLKAFGINFDRPILGFDSPRLVGPFNVFDARAMGSQSVFNLSAIRGFQASRAAVRQAEAETESVKDQIRAQVSGAYLAAQSAEASVDAWASNVALSEAMLQLAVNQKSAGTGTGIEVTRARVQLANDRQQLLVIQNHRRSAHLRLLKIMGLDLHIPIELTESMSYLPFPSLTTEQALKTAFETRTDWRAQERRERTAELKSSSVKMERVPSLSLFADYGSLGNAVNDSIPTRTYGFSVRIPLYDGGRREARRAESASLLRQERIRGQDLLAQIELEIRVALDGLQSADEQVKAAEEGLNLSDSELTQAQRRYQAGVTTNLEVTQAQARVARARENRIGALLNYNLARIDLLTAMGTIGQITP